MNKLYFLVRQGHGTSGFVAYASGISIYNIPSFHECKIMRMYPGPDYDLTPQLICLQQIWKRHLRFRRWCSHPVRLYYRQIHGRWPRWYDRQ